MVVEEGLESGVGKLNKMLVSSIPCTVLLVLLYAVF
jgi:SNF family Na+-dependent transporter